VNTSPAQRPRDLNALINETASGYQRGFPVLVVLSLLPSIPSLLFSIVAGPTTARLASPGFRPTTAADVTAIFATPGFVIGGALAFAVTVIAAPFLFGAPYAAAVAIVEGRPVTVGSALATCAQRYVSLWALFAAIFLVLAGLCLTCIGIPFAIWIGVRWALAPAALFGEDRGAMAALGTSWEIVRDHWWRTFGLLLLVGLAVGVASGIVGGVFSVVALVMPECARPAIRGVASAIVSAFLGPIDTLFVTLLYFDLLARRLILARA
jgi:hypothetical protein